MGHAGRCPRGVSVVHEGGAACAARLSLETNQGLPMPQRTPRENSELPANRPAHALAGSRRVTRPAAEPVARPPCHLLPCRPQSSGGEQTSFNHPSSECQTRTLGMHRATTQSPPAFSSPAPPPLRRALFCFHYPRAYLTTTAQPPTGPDSTLLSHIIKLPNTRNRCLDPTLRLSLYWPA